MSKGPYSLTSPCPDCPFRSDVRPYLREARVRQLEVELERKEFHCHKTTRLDGDGDTYSDGESVHCAGALILMEKEGRSSQMMRIAERLGLYDPSRLDMDAPVYGSFTEMVEAMREASPGTPPLDADAD